MREFDWDDVRLFLVIADQGSLAKAAKQLKVSSATLSRRLEAMERALGHRLFDRLPHRLAITAAGQRLLDGANLMRNGADALARSAASVDHAGKSPVRITATVSMSTFLAHHLAELTARCPGIVIEVIATRAQLSLAKREAEIALRMRRPPEKGALTVRRLARVAIALYATPAYLDRVGYKSGDPLSHLDLIGTERSPAFSRQEAWLAAACGLDRVHVRLSETNLRHAATVAGVGAALLQCAWADGDPALVRINEPPEELVEDVYMLIHEDLRGQVAVRTVADALIDLFARHRNQLAAITESGRATQ